MEPYVRNDVVQAKRIGMSLGQMLDQMAIDLAAAVTRADIASDNALGRSVAEKGGCGAHSANHGSRATVDREAPAINDDGAPAQCCGPQGKGQVLIRNGSGQQYRFHASSLRASSNAILRV